MESRAKLLAAEVTDVITGLASSFDADNPSGLVARGSTIALLAVIGFAARRDADRRACSVVVKILLNVAHGAMLTA